LISCACELARHREVAAQPGCAEAGAQLLHQEFDIAANVRCTGRHRLGVKEHDPKRTEGLGLLPVGRLDVAHRSVCSCALRRWLVGDLGSELIRQVLGLDLDNRVSCAGADRLDTIAAGLQIHLAGHPAVLDHKIAALAIATVERLTAKHNHVAWARHRTQLAGHGTAAWQCDLKTTRLVVLGG